MKLGKNLIVSFLLILIFTTYFFIFSYQNKKQAENLNKRVIHTHLVIEEITTLKTLITELESEVRGFVISGNPDFIQNVENDEKTVYEQYKILKDLTVDNPEQQ